MSGRVPTVAERLTAATSSYSMRKAARTGATLLVAYTLAFGIVVVGGTNPFARSTADHTAWQAAAVHERYALLLSQYLHGELGHATSAGAPVAQVVAEAVPWTLLLLVSSTFLAMAIGTLVGLVMVYYEGRWLDFLLSGGVIVLRAIPGFVVGIVLLIVLFYEWQLFPARGGGYAFGTTPGFDPAFVVGVLQHAALPIAASVIAHFSGALAMRASGIRVLGESYVRAARIRGLGASRIAFHYVGRNALLPVYTSLVVYFVELLGSNLVIEYVFLYPGLGVVLRRAAERGDFPLLAGVVFVLAVIASALVLVADLTYGYVDLRAGTSTEGETVAWRPLSRARRWVVRQFSSATAGTDAIRSADVTERLDRSLDPAADGGAGEPLVENSRRWFASARAAARLVWLDARGKVGVVVLGAFALVGTVGPVLVELPPTNEGPHYLQPFERIAFPLGTDHLGRSMLDILIHGTTPMLELVCLGAVVATALAVVVGVLAGYVGGSVETLLVLAIDVVVVLPGFPLVYALMPLYEISDPMLVAGTLGLTYWGGAAREIRAQVLATRSETYVEASRTMGLSTRWIVTRDVLPQVAPYALVKFVETVRYVMVSLIALYFLGAFTWSANQQPWMVDVNWGVFVYRAWSHGMVFVNPDARYMFFLPLAAVVLVLLGTSFLAQSMDELANVRLRRRNAALGAQVETDRESAERPIDSSGDD